MNDRLSEAEVGGAAAARLAPGDSIPGLKVTPDRYLPHRYAGASGDFNPIHIDREFAEAVGLPGNILHGLYSMALVSRAVIALAGDDPRALKRLSVQFRGMGLPEREIAVAGTVESRDGNDLRIAVEASQDEKPVIRNAIGELALPGG